MKQVWLNLNTGEFSNSWQKDEFDMYSEKHRMAEYNGWKLIEYTCPNDPNFEFYDQMKITTNIKSNETAK
jgi:hypothetical protein